VDSRDQTSWFELMPPDGPGPTVVAVPYAGGSGRAFRSLRRHVPADCGLALVDLPGHGRQVNGTCLRDADQAATGLLEALDALPATGFVLLGHSLGGVLAYEVAARLTERGAPPAGLVVCGSRAPFTGLGHPPVAHMPSGEPFLRAAVDLGLAAPEMLELPDLAEAFGGMLQADMAMTASYHRPGTGRLAGDRGAVLSVGCRTRPPGRDAAAAVSSGVGRVRRPRRRASAGRAAPPGSPSAGNWPQT